jgi:DNA-binding MarR family transcriptional regulator
MPPDPLKRVREARELVDQLEYELRQARLELGHTMFEAVEAGESLTAIGRITGITRQRVKQVIDRFEAGG